MSSAPSTSESGGTEPPSKEEDKRDNILNAIEHTRERLETKTDEVTVDLSILRDDHKKLAERVTRNESAVGGLQPTVKDTQTQLAELTDHVRYLEGRAEDAEGRARRNNLRIVGLPEGVEGRDPLLYLENCLKSLMPQGALS